MIVKRGHSGQRNASWKSQCNSSFHPQINICWIWCRKWQLLWCLQMPTWQSILCPLRNPCRNAS